MSLVPKYKYLGNYPENRENGWSDELQGVCHDENFWYFSQNNHDSCSKKTGRIQNPERKYFLNRREQEGREHEMHMEGCSHMPAEKNLIPLGVFVTMEDAMEKAKTIFPQVDGCYFCCRRLDSDRKRQRIE